MYVPRFPGEFWEYLFNQDWHEGYSVRVLEGRLQSLLMSVLVALTSAGQVTQHSTIAFAKNRRYRNSIYKQSSKVRFIYILVHEKKR